MEAKKRILLYGNSVILGTIEASVKRSSGFEVTTLPQKEPQPLDDRNPDVLVFDLDATKPQEVLSFLRTDPAMLLIGISPDINLIRVWSIREFKDLTIKDLLQLIMSEAKDKPVESGGNEVHLFEALPTDRRVQEIT